MKYTYMFATDEEITDCLNCPINQDIGEKDFCPISDDSNYVFPSFRECPLYRIVNGGKHQYKVKLSETRKCHYCGKPAVNTIGTPNGDIPVCEDHIEEK